MLGWALTFFIIAIIAAAFGFGSWGALKFSGEGRPDGPLTVNRKLPINATD